MDKNRSGPYICVFGIAIDKGQRQIRKSGKTKVPHSVNTEVWLSDFFWPFFANYTYAEIAKAVFEVLMETGRKGEQLVTMIPDALIDSFGEECRARVLLDDEGKFNDPLRLIPHPHSRRKSKPLSFNDFRRSERRRFQLTGMWSKASQDDIGSYQGRGADQLDFKLGR